MRWYFCHGTKFEEFTPIYNDGTYILVQSDATGKYSFGLTSDFGTLYGFPVVQSDLSLKSLLKVLDRFIEIDKEDKDPCNTLEIYEAMKRALRRK